ncbi:MAG: MCE family protein [Bacteroidetes bacterium]|nr:MCE family protein [Bacteroidota bacterium]
MPKITKEVKVALLAVTAIVLFIIGLGYLKGRSVFGNRNYYYVHFTHVSGLPTGSKVQLSGTDVGVVQELKLDPKTRKVTVGFDVNADIELPEDTRVVLTTTDLFGSKALILLPGQSNKMAAHKAVLKDSIAPELMDKASSYLDPTSRKLNLVLDNLGEITGQINSLMKRDNSRAKQSVDNLEATLANLASLSARLNKSVQQLDMLMASTQNLVNNPDLKGTLTNIRQSTDSLAATTQDVRQLAVHTQRLVKELQTLSQNLNEGQGTAGKLLKDKELYDNLTKTTASLNSLLEDLKKHPKRYVHFSVFGRKEKSPKP